MKEDSYPFAEDPALRTLLTDIDVLHEDELKSILNQYDFFF